MHRSSDHNFVQDRSDVGRERFRNVSSHRLANNRPVPSTAGTARTQQPFPYQQSCPRNLVSDSSNQSPFPCQRMVESIPQETAEEWLNPATRLIDVENRFSSMIITTESIAHENSLCGFQIFITSNRDRTTHCWQKQIGPSYLPSPEPEERVVPLGTNESIPDISCRIPAKEDTNDYFSDINAALRCKAFLKGKKCVGLCQKIHRLPKEDGVVCVANKRGQCYLGSKCNFFHEEMSDDSETDGGAGELPPEETAVSFQQLGNISVKDDITLNEKNGQSFEDAELFDPLPPSTFSDVEFAVDFKSNSIAAAPSENDFSASISSSQNSLLKNHRGVKIGPKAVNPIMFSIQNSGTESSGSAPDNFSSSPTPNESCVSTGVKRALPSSTWPCVKREKLDEDVSLRGNEHIRRAIKCKPEDEVVLEESVEDMVAVPVKSEVYSRIDTFSSSPAEEREHDISGNLVCTIKASQGFGYDIPSLDKLHTVSRIVFDLIGASDENYETAPTASSEMYGKLCKYLADQGIQILSEVNHSKLLVWDVHIRLFFNSILGVDSREYLRDIEKHLIEESFENYLSRVLNTFGISLDA